MKLNDARGTWTLHAPSTDDAARLLKAWRLWAAAAIAGALLAAFAYWIAPPPYRARATVLLDFNLEEAWPEETDRQQFYYLEREVRKLEEIAWSDSVLQAVTQPGRSITISMLRDSRLHLSLPGEAGWHFYADDPAPDRAAALATAWANEFARQSKMRIESGGGPNSLIVVELTQAAGPPVGRSVPIGAYLLAGSLMSIFLTLFLSLFVRRARL